MHYYDRVQGEYYTSVLQKMYAMLSPKTYLEIGSRDGLSLSLSQCASIAVDPRFNVNLDVIGNKPCCHFYQMTSDQFFRNHSPREIFASEIEFSFLDGMHLAEFLIRDLRNTEMHSRQNSIIAIHDCIPGEYAITMRHEGSEQQQAAINPAYWTGDVWKIIPVVKRFRPDLRLVVLDSSPTGLILVTNLDPSNRVFFDKYHEIVDMLIELDREEEFEKFWTHLQILSTEDFYRSNRIHNQFWL